MTDLVARAKAALEGVTEGPWKWDAGDLLSTTAVDTWQTGGHPGWPKESIEHHSEPAKVLSIEEYENFLMVSEENADFIAEARSLVPELVAEVERLRAGGPWVEHVERMNAMKRQRDGECICDCNPETTTTYGPDEFCPWHGRSYNELVERLESQAAEVDRLRQLVVRQACTCNLPAGVHDDFHANNCGRRQS